MRLVVSPHLLHLEPDPSARKPARLGWDGRRRWQQCGKAVVQKGRTDLFLCTNGPAFYGFAASGQRFSMERRPSETAPLETPDGVVVPLPSGVDLTLDWAIA